MMIDGAALEEKIRRHRVPGASVAVLREGETAVAAAGVTNIVTGVPMTPDALMHIGSITKVLNATLVMQLVDEGRVELDERVLRYLPDLRLSSREALEQITVRMLLNHTSGIDGDMLPDCGHDEETIEKGIARFANLGQLFRPGTEFSYCNAGTVIAGYLAQRLQGKSWYRLLRERIFEPLELRHAAALPEEALLHRASVGHFLDARSGQPKRTSFAFLPLSFAPCGTSLMMSARDLVTFASAHNTLISERSAREMQRAAIDHTGKGYIHTDGMGIGWMLYRDGWLHHSGGGPGIVSVLYVHPSRGLAIAILTNAEHSLGLINELLRDLGAGRPLGGADVRLPAERVEIDAGRYVGVYEDVMNRYHVLEVHGRLALSRQPKFAWYDTISTEPTPPTPLIALGGDQFLLESHEPDDSGIRFASTPE